MVHTEDAPDTGPWSPLSRTRCPLTNASVSNTFAMSWTSARLGLAFWGEFVVARGGVELPTFRFQLANDQTRESRNKPSCDTDSEQGLGRSWRWPSDWLMPKQ